MKKISVIIPCYNVASYIDKCMLSITAQTIGMVALEVICVDDGSTDNTWRYLQKWERMFPDDILLIRQPVNRRQGAARNLGLQYASAEWIAFVDADDWLEFDYFQRLYDPTTRYVCDVVACGTMRDRAELSDCFNEDKRQPGQEYHITANTKEVREAMLRYKLMGIGPAAKLIRKEILFKAEIFFPEEMAYEDHYWVPLLYLYTTNAYVIEEQLYHYFWNPRSTSLMRDQDYQVDCLTIQMLKWEDYQKRGLWDDYRSALEYDLMWYAVLSMNMLICYRTDPPYSFFLLAQRIIRQQIPDSEWIAEEYIREGFEKQYMILQALYSTVTKAGFYQLVEIIKNK